MYNITNKKLGEMSTSEEWTNEYRRGKPFPEWRTSLNIIDDLFMGSITDPSCRCLHEKRWHYNLNNRSRVAKLQ